MHLPPGRNDNGFFYDFSHSHLSGGCPHECSYCSVRNSTFATGPQSKFLFGPIKENEKKYRMRYENYGVRSIMLENYVDMFSDWIPSRVIQRILLHCKRYEKHNIFMFQTKNPGRYMEFMGMMPKAHVLGTTIETNRDTSGISKAPVPEVRYRAMLELPKGTPTFVSIDPMLECDLDVLVKWIEEIDPMFITMGKIQWRGYRTWPGMPLPSREKRIEIHRRLTDTVHSYGVRGCLLENVLSCSERHWYKDTKYNMKGKHNE